MRFPQQTTTDIRLNCLGLYKLASWCFLNPGEDVYTALPRMQYADEGSRKQYMHKESNAIC